MAFLVLILFGLFIIINCDDQKRRTITDLSELNEELIPIPDDPNYDPNNCVFTCENDMIPWQLNNDIFKVDGCHINADGSQYDFNAPPLVVLCCDLHDMCYQICDMDYIKCDISYDMCIQNMCELQEQQYNMDKYSCLDGARTMFISMNTKTKNGCKRYKQYKQNNCKCVSKNDIKKNVKETLKVIYKRLDKLYHKKSINKLIKKYQNNYGELIYDIISKYHKKDPTKQALIEYIEPHPYLEAQKKKDL